MKPKEAFVAVTYRCNSRCSMCNIWRNTEHSEMGPEHYAKLPESLRTINITGGEPFMREDILDVVRAIDSKIPSSRLVFSTNGLTSERIVDCLKEIREFHPKVGVGVSIDGLEETHDRIRGVPGIFRNAISTVKLLKASGFKDLRIGMTLMKENVGEAARVYQLSKELGVEFTTTFAHNSEIYFHKTDNSPPEFQEPAYDTVSVVLNSHLRSWSAKDWFRAYHMYGILDPKLRSEFTSRCEAGRRYLFVSPNGDIFPCMVMNERIGNLRNVDSWDDMFTQEVELRIARQVRNCTEDCWMVCNTRSLIISHPLKAGVWVAKNKVKAHFVQ
jgi:radical SAM protein with 4Fe4S-binding SPASM domain